MVLMWKSLGNPRRPNLGLQGLVSPKLFLAPRSRAGTCLLNGLPALLIMLAFISTLTFFSAGTALADQPIPWQTGFQEAATPMMERINGFHNLLLWIISCIAGFVMLLMITIIIRYNARANPTPAKFSHNTLLEVGWTIIPVVILALIAIPSFRLLYFIETIPEADMTIKATGYQWYWGYEYPDHFADEEFIANMISDDELGADANGNPQPRLLATDFDVVVPVGKIVRVIVTAADVIHAWAIPAFGIKIDAVPGRLNETWFKADRTGIFYGQCSELCGTKHSFMPIAVRVVSQQDWQLWVQQIRDEYGIAAVSAGAALAVAE